MNRHEIRAISAAACLEFGVKETALLRAFGEQAMDESADYRRPGLRGIVKACAEGAGYESASYGEDMIRAALSTASLPLILSNTINQLIVSAYQSVGAVADVLCASVPLNDFRPTVRARLTADGFEKIGAAGEVSRTLLSDEGWNITPDTRAMVIEVTRENLLNDDAGAFQQVARNIARSAAIVKDRLAIETLLSGGDFFSTGNANFITGADTALSLTSLTAAAKSLREQVDAAGRPLLTTPRYLLIPPALEGAAMALYRTTAVGADASLDEPWTARFKPVCSAFLGTASGLANASDTAWYLLSDPQNIPVLEAGYVGGRQIPQVYEGNANFYRLSMDFGATFDFGIALADPRAAIQCSGAE